MKKSALATLVLAALVSAPSAFAYEAGDIIVRAGLTSVSPNDDSSNVNVDALGGNIPQDKRFSIFSCWPGPVTWLLPKSATAPTWLTGEHNAIAVRVTAHEGARELCNKLGRPIVSTSANLTGQEPARTTEEARSYFANSVHYVEGSVGGAAQPSTIKDALTGTTIRN